MTGWIDGWVHGKRVGWGMEECVGIDGGSEERKEGGRNVWRQERKERAGWYG